MENLIKYKKYSNLENYLFGDVSNDFNKNHYLTNEEFFTIIIWKSNRSKTRVLNGIKKSEKTIKEITEEVYKEKELKNKVEILKKIDGIGIPIASAILAVCYPNDFTITDYRATNSLEILGEKITKNPALSSSSYLDYVNICKKLKDRYNCSLREFDRILWGIDWYEGKGGLKELIKGL